MKAPAQTITVSVPRLRAGHGIAYSEATKKKITKNNHKLRLFHSFFMHRVRATVELKTRKKHALDTSFFKT